MIIENTLDELKDLYFDVIYSFTKEQFEFFKRKNLERLYENSESTEFVHTVIDTLERVRNQLVVRI